MKIVNKSGIPESLFKYLSVDLYDYDEKGDSFSATEILNPPQIVILKRRHWNEIEIDAIDQLWKLLGTGVHAILEHEKGMEKIERLKIKVFGHELSGRWDRIINNKITDYKVTSAWTVAYGSRKEEWTEQLSIYRLLYWVNKGILLEATGYIVALLRDWSEKNLKPLKYGVNKYPKAPAMEIPLELLSIEATEKMIEKKLIKIMEAESLSDGKLPECTDSDRWYNKDKKTYLRCAKYCEVSKFCKQLAREKEREDLENAEEVGEPLEPLLEEIK